MVKKEWRWIVLCVLTMAYAIVARGFGLPAYWWKTSMCFPVGYVLADRSVFIAGFLEKKTSTILVLAAAGISYIGILLEGYCIFLLKLILWPLLAVSVILVMQRLGFDSIFFRFIGGASLSLYLLHIGIVEEAMRPESNVGVVVFILAVTIGTFVTEFLSRRMWRTWRRWRSG